MASPPAEAAIPDIGDGNRDVYDSDDTDEADASPGDEDDESDDDDVAPLPQVTAVRPR